MKRKDADDSYRPVTARQRLWIVVLAMSVSFTVLWSLLERPGGLEGPKATVINTIVEPPRCGPGQTAGCVGGMVEVIVVPAL